MDRKYLSHGMRPLIGTTAAHSGAVNTSPTQGHLSPGRPAAGPANLTIASPLFAFLGNAILTGVTWSNTTCPRGKNSTTKSPQTCIGHGI